MSNLLLQPIAEPIRADYNIYDFHNGIFKIVRFKSTAPHIIPGDRKNRKGNDTKLEAALSRARRVVLELALCNDWKYFCTFTITGTKYDRNDLQSFHKRFTQWLRDYRKKYPGLDIRFVLVPEQHEDGSWHMHGLFSDITPVLVSFKELWECGENIPWKLVKNGYLNWTDYQNKFGFCSFGLIKNKVAAGFYVTKYLSKQLSDSAIGVGLHLYYASRGLNRADLHGDIYGQCGYLDQFLTNHYDFCDTGMTHVKDGCTWNFAMEYMEVEALETFGTPDQADILEVDTYYEVVHEALEGF